MIIAHRGASKEAPQNTMPAFIRACERGACGIETDAHITGDGQVVLCHDYTVDKISDGTGKIRSMTLSELMRLDFGSAFSEKFKDTRIPTLDGFFEEVRRFGLRIINVEIKPDKKNYREIVKETISAAKRHGVFGQMLISSFNAEILREAKRVDPECKTGLLYPYKNNAIACFFRAPLSKAKKIKADAIHPHKSMVRRRIVKKAHRFGIKVNAWTVNSLKDARKLINAGADGLITDLPGEMIAAFR